MIQDVLDKVLGACNKDAGKAGEATSKPVHCTAVTLEFYSVNYDQQGARSCA